MLRKQPKLSSRAAASACELLDRTFLDYVRDAADVGDAAARAAGRDRAVLLIEIEGDSVAHAQAAAA